MANAFSYGLNDLPCPCPLDVDSYETESATPYGSIMASRSNLQSGMSFKP